MVQNVTFAPGTCGLEASQKIASRWFRLRLLAWACRYGRSFRQTCGRHDATQMRLCAMKTFRGSLNESEARDLFDRLGAMAVRARLDHAAKISNGILEYPDDPRRNDATKILECTAQIRRALERGNGLSIAGQMEQLHRLCAASNDKITRPLIEHAVKVKAPFIERANAENSQRHNKAEIEREKWQQQANKIWNVHPTWRKTRVAEKIVKDNPDANWNSDLIRRKLAKP